MQNTFESKEKAVNYVKRNYINSNTTTNNHNSNSGNIMDNSKY